MKVLLNLFEEKIKQIDKVTLKRRYFKSLFLIDLNYTKYDCNLTLFFIRRNVHFNFKTETHIFDYFSECSLLAIKNASFNSLTNVSRVEMIFSDFLAYLFWLILLLVLFIGIYCCKNVPIERDGIQNVSLNESKKTNTNSLEKVTYNNLKKSIIGLDSDLKNEESRSRASLHKDQKDEHIIQSQEITVLEECETKYNHPRT